MCNADKLVVDGIDEFPKHLEQCLTRLISLTLCSLNVCHDSGKYFNTII